MEPRPDAGTARPGADDPPVDGDAIDHLWNAAHEMLRAMRTLLDAADEFVESQRGERPGRRDAARAGDARGSRAPHRHRSGSSGTPIATRSARRDAGVGVERPDAS